MQDDASDISSVAPRPEQASKVGEYILSVGVIILGIIVGAIAAVIIGGALGWLRFVC